MEPHRQADTDLFPGVEGVEVWLTAGLLLAAASSATRGRENLPESAAAAAPIRARATAKNTAFTYMTADNLLLGLLQRRWR